MEQRQSSTKKGESSFQALVLLEHIEFNLQAGATRAGKLNAIVPRG
jgi:hypothetical protein